MATYSSLNQTHPSIDPDWIADLQALYAGGQSLKARARRFIPQNPNEPDEIYTARIARPRYRNYLGAVIDHFSAALFSHKPTAVATRGGQELHDHESAYYSDFATDCDRAGTDVSAFFKSAFTDACVTGAAWILVHDPIDMSGLEPPKNKLNWQNRGLGNFWVERLESGRVLDWETDENGNLIFAVVHDVSTFRNDPAAVRDTLIETWDIFTRNDVERFQAVYKASNPPTPDEPILSLGVRAHPFGRVPLLCMSFDVSQHLAARLESPQVAHLNDLNAEAWSLSRCAYAMPLFKLEGDQNSRPMMGTGWSVILRPSESAEWLEPAGTHLDALDRTIRTHKDELFRVAAAMALGSDNSATAIGRSAESKQIDAAANRIAMLNFADRVREEMGRLYALLSDVRGERDVTWRIDGLTSLDVAGYLEGLKTLRDGLGGDVHSPDARAALESAAVEALLPTTKPEQKNAWRQQTLDAIRAEPTPAQAELASFAAMHAVANTTTPARRDEHLAGHIRAQIAALA